MNTNYNMQIIKDTVDFVETHIRSALSLDALSEQLHISKFHLHRLISSATGMPLVRYIRARKLSHSLKRLLEPGMRIIDVSTEYNFQYEQTYIRSFKKQFGITPALFRRGSYEIRTVEKFDISSLINVAGGIIFKPSFVIKPAFYLAGLKYNIGIDHNLQHALATHVGNDFFNHHRLMIPNRVNENVYFGLTQLVDDPSYSNYLPSIEVNATCHIPSNYQTTLIPHNGYIVFKYMGSFHPSQLTIHHLHDIWSYIDQWLPESPYYHCAPYFFEYIDVTLANEAYCEIDLYIPIKPRLESPIIPDHQ